MPHFTYQGTDPTGALAQGVLEAPTEIEARAALRKMRIRPDSITAKSTTPFSGISLLSKPALKDISSFTRQFAAMNTSGIPLVECLDTIAEQIENKTLQKTIIALSQDVQSGISLADAMAKHPAIFNRLYCAMIRAGEAAGILSTVLLRLADYQEQSVELQRRVKSAFAYPALVSVVAVGAILALFIFVVPTFSSMLAEIGSTPPLSTRIVIAISGIVKAWLLPAVAVLTVLFLGLIYSYRKNGKTRYRVDSLMLTLPYFGKVQQKSSIARFGRTFGALLIGGVPIAQALEITAGTANNRVLEEAFYKTLEAIKSGRSLAEPLRESKVFPPMVVQMISVGERGGNLPEMLEKVSDYYDTEVNTAISTLTSVLEPVLIVIMGVVIAAVLISMYLPMFQMISAFG